MKRVYIKPDLTQVQIDREISLVMMTDEITPPDPPQNAPPLPSSTKTSKFQSNPFGAKK